MPCIERDGEAETKGTSSLVQCLEVPWVARLI